jgi:hypothetical protein
MQLIVSNHKKKLVRSKKSFGLGHKKTLKQGTRVFGHYHPKKAFILRREMPPCMPYRGKQGTQLVIRTQA